MHSTNPSSHSPPNELQQNPLTLAEAKQRMRQFVDDRQWHHFHTPRNLVMALMGEVGEVAQLFQWKGEVKEGLPEFTAEERSNVADELADVLSYLVRLADVCHVDLAEAFLRKQIKNAQKYPKDLVKGSSKKYTEYKLGKVEKEEGGKEEQAADRK